MIARIALLALAGLLLGAADAPSARPGPSFAEDCTDNFIALDEAARLQCYARNVRRRFADYDRWTIADLAKLHRFDSDVTRSFAMGTSREWQALLIPAAIRRQHGDLAAPLFMAVLFNQMRASDTLGFATTGILGGLLQRIGGFTSAEIQGIDNKSPITIRFNDGRTMRATPVDAINYHIATRMLENADSATATFTDIDIPASVLRGLIETNPGLRAKIEKIPMLAADGSRVPLSDPRAVGSAQGIRLTPSYAYDSGQASQSGLSRSIMRLGVADVDPAKVCPTLLSAEVKIYDARADDITIRDAWYAGALRAAIGANGCDAVQPQGR